MPTPTTSKKLISQKRAPVTQIKDTNVTRAIQQIYSDLNEIINTVNSSEIDVEKVEGEKSGRAGNIRITERPYTDSDGIQTSTYFIEGKTREGWVTTSPLEFIKNWDGAYETPAKVFTRGLKVNGGAVEINKDMEDFNFSVGSEVSGNIIKVDAENNRVGIGTSSPMTILDVDGALRVQKGAELTIASGAITVTHSLHKIDTENDAGSDILETINGGNGDGQILIISTAASSRDVTAKDNDGNLVLNGDFVMDNYWDTLTLMYNNSKWMEIARSNNV